MATLEEVATLLSKLEPNLKKKEINIIQWEISPEMIASWNCLNPEFPRHKAMDCAINTIRFFEIIKQDTAEQLSRKLNIEQHGFDNDYTLELINQYLKTGLNDREFKYHHTLHNIIINYDWRNKIKQLIRPGYATICIGSRKTSSHMFVIWVLDNGQIAFIDPQQHQYYGDDESVDTFIESEKYIFLSFVQYTGKARELDAEISKEYQVKKVKPDKDGHISKKRRLNTPPLQTQPQPQPPSRRRISSRRISSRHLSSRRRAPTPAVPPIQSRPISSSTSSATRRARRPPGLPSPDRSRGLKKRNRKIKKSNRKIKKSNRKIKKN